MHAHRIQSILSAVLIITVSACANTVEDEFDHHEPEDTRDNVLFQGVYDCTETEDDGYRQGNRFDISVVRVDGRPVEVSTANAYIAMQNAARNAGVTLRIVSGFRTMGQQQYLYGCYTNCNCNSCNLAARPGYSNHQSGHALDLNTRDAGVLSWLNNNASRFGFRRTVPSEAWHWEWWGNASDYPGPCGGGSGSGGSDSTPSNDAPSDCEAVPGEGGVIDDGDNCFVPGGPVDYLRAVDSGHDGDSIWTGSTTHNSAVNYAEWWLKVSEPGRYRVEAYVNASLATSRQTKYAIRSALGNTSVVVDQTTNSGFRNLGEITLDPSTPGRVRVGDNTGESGSKKIVFDAIRLTKIEDSTCRHVRVETDGGPLNVRSSASTSGTIRGTVGDGEVLVRTSSTSGQSIRGVTTWHQIQEGSLTGWVSGAYTVCVD